MEEWILKLTELTEMAKLIAPIREDGLDKFIRVWNPFVEFL